MYGPSPARPPGAPRSTPLIGGDLPADPQGLGPTRRNVWVLVGVVGGLLAVLGVLSRGTNLFGGLGDRRGSVGSAFVRAIIGGAAAAALVAVVIAVLRSKRTPEQRGELGKWLPIVMLVAVALGALLGVATTPLDRSIDGSPIPEESGSPESRNELRPVDQDGDGEPDTDAMGNLIYGQDTDGDGKADQIYISCETLRANQDAGPDEDVITDGDANSVEEARPLPPRRVPGDGDLVAIDDDCDGRIDRYLTFKRGSIELDDRLSTGDREGLSPGRNEAPPPAANNEQKQPESSRGGGSLGGVMAVLLAVIALAVLGWIVMSIVRNGGLAGWRQRFQRAPKAAVDSTIDEPASQNEAVAAAFTSTIDPLGHPDPRVAINAAYAQLLDGLAQIGMARRTHEAPQEHLDRVLGSSSIDRDASLQLVEVFALARFSSHPITEDHRHLALAALRTIAGQLTDVGAPR